ncbi:hypothetical protein KQX62_07740 [Rhodopseudomonas palustris]|uniref:Uncharacterized protein n=1 Tax=Rhodopseudomonas palustris TaxID=1076 RepID=A0AAX3E339_RHOPL|nr:hypothetical protein [Rhodopseudomonas palustris]UYO41182.1 hypothetical protein KQX62_07740 [Rhodopseudomonas palustris]
MSRISTPFRNCEIALAVNKLQNFPEGGAERRAVLIFCGSEQFVSAPRWRRGQPHARSTGDTLIATVHASGEIEVDLACSTWQLAEGRAVF